MSDYRSLPTSINFIRFCKEYDIEQIFATFNNHKGNADTERVIRTLKKDVVWLNQYETMAEFFEESIGLKNKKLLIVLYSCKIFDLIFGYKYIFLLNKT